MKKRTEKNCSYDLQKKMKNGLQKKFLGNIQRQKQKETKEKVSANFWQGFWRFPAKF